MTDALQVEYRPIKSLKAHPQNSRVHSKAQVTQIAKSIKAFGFTNPILVDESGVILAGHGRWAGGKEAKLAQVPVIVLRGLTEEQKRAYIIADNRIAEESEWDKDKLMAEVEALSSVGFDLAFLDLGKLDSDLAEMLGDARDLETPEDKRDREEGEKAQRDRKKPSKHKTGGDPHGDPDEEQVSDPSKDNNSVNFPLYVILAPPMYKQWKTLRGQLSDKQFVTKLLDKAEAITSVMNG